MAVEIAAQGWGVVIDTAGRPRSGQPVAFSGSVYADSAKTTPITSLATQRDGTIPGWTDPGTYTLTVDGVTHTVEAVSGSGGSGGSVSDSSATVKGVTRLSVAPASSTIPIAVGDNDPRMSRVPPAGASGAAQNLKHKRDNTIVWVNETRIDATNYVPTDGSSDCSPGVAAAISAEGAGVLTFPPGNFIFTPSSTYKGQDLSNNAMNIQGSGVFATNLWRTTDFDSAMFVLGNQGGIRDCSIVGSFGVTPSNVASAPVGRGVILRDKSWLDNVRVEGFGKGVVVDGNHQHMEGVTATNCKHNLVYAQNMAGYTTAHEASFSHGNQTLLHCDFTGGGEASVYVAGDSKIDASTWIQVHMGNIPHGILFAPKTTQEMALGNSDMINCSFESCGKNFIEDLGWNTTSRRLSAYVHWHSPETGALNAGQTTDGVLGTEMFKVSQIVDWEIFGRVGDSSNSSFSTTGGGTTSTACGFRVEKASGIVFHNADLLFNESVARGVPMFRLEGAQLQFDNVVFTLYKRYRCAVGLASENLSNEQLVQPYSITNGDPWDQGFGSVKKAAGTGPVIGRVIGSNALAAAGYLVPICIEGALNGPPTAAADNAIVAGDPLMVDSTNPGSVKKWDGSAAQVVGTALKNSAGGSVAAHLRFAWSQVV